jgi:hypothetical protein
MLQIAKYIDMLNTVYGELYNMSMSNIVQLGNVTMSDSDDKHQHVYFQFIPRYHQPVTRYGRTFTDSQYGKPLNLDPESGLEVYKPSDSVIAEMKEEISAAIQNYIANFKFNPSMDIMGALKSDILANFMNKKNMT